MPRSGNCGMGSTLVCWKLQNDDHCPRCGHCKDSTHVYNCKGQEASHQWETGINKCLEYLDQVQTDPNVKDALIQSLSDWRYNRDPIPNYFHPRVLPAVTQQSHIKWHSLPEGLAGTQWRTTSTCLLYSALHTDV